MIRALESRVRRILAHLRAAFTTTPVYMTVVRRYLDAQGNYIGELYLRDDSNKTVMVGVTCDNLPFSALQTNSAKARIDTRNDFNTPMSKRTIRVGAIEPRDNDAVRQRVSLFRFRYVHISIHNRFIEAVLETNQP